MVPQVHTKIFTNSLKSFYYICGIKFQNNGRKMQYAVKNILKPTLSAPTDPTFEAGKTAITMVQKEILDTIIF